MASLLKKKHDTHTCTIFQIVYLWKKMKTISYVTSLRYFFLIISVAALSSLQIMNIFCFQFDILCSSAFDIVWDCQPAFSVNFFESIWRTRMTKMTVKIKKICKTKKKRTNNVLCWFRVAGDEYGRSFLNVGLIFIRKNNVKNQQRRLFWFCNTTQIGRAICF